MTEAEWNQTNNPQKMIEWLTGRNQRGESIAGIYSTSFRYPTNRKARLFCYAWRQLAGMDERNIHRDENVDPETVLYLQGGSVEWMRNLVALQSVSSSIVADLLRHIFGNPFKPWNAIRCELCLGRKKSAYYSTVDCSLCKGKGWILGTGIPTVAPDKKSVQCPHCKLPGRYCRICFGSTKANVFCTECFDQKTIWTGMDGMKWIPCPHCPKEKINLPSVITELATALYDGEGCSFALADALEEEGLMSLAEHFRESEDSKWGRRSIEHMRGCFELDLLLGKE